MCKPASHGRGTHPQRTQLHLRGAAVARADGERTFRLLGPLQDRCNRGLEAVTLSTKRCRKRARLGPLLGGSGQFPLELRAPDAQRGGLGASLTQLPSHGVEHSGTSLELPLEFRKLRCQSRSPALFRREPCSSRGMRTLFRCQQLCPVVARRHQRPQHRIALPQHRADVGSGTAKGLHGDEQSGTQPPGSLGSAVDCQGGGSNNTVSKWAALVGSTVSDAGEIFHSMLHGGGGLGARLHLPS